MKLKRKSGLGFLILLLALYGCSAGSNYISDFDNTITIDGIQSDWKGNFNNIKDVNIGVGFKNDDKSLYICLVTGDRMNMMKILRNGLTVRLDPENGETVGIRYPINYNSDKPMEDFRMMKERNTEEDDPGEMINKLIAAQNEISIVNEDNFPIYAYSLDNKQGFSAKLGYSFKQFVYELKVPLAGNNASKIILDALPGEQIEVVFETGEIEKPKMDMRGRMPGGKATSGSAPGMGNRRPPSGGGMGKRDDIKKMTEKIEAHCIVKLSSSNSKN